MTISSPRRLLAAVVVLALLIVGGLSVRATFSGAPAATTIQPVATSAASVGSAGRAYRWLSDASRAGQRVIGGFSGHAVPAGLRRAIREGRIGGVILFADNLGSRNQVRRLTSDLQRIPRPAGLRRTRLPVMVDQEGGLVKRLAGAPQMPAKEMGARGPAVARSQGRKTGRNLANAGFNVDLAPVLDVARPGGVIDQTDRAFGRSPARVGQVGMAFAEGLREGGVAATAKHFPGLGAARVNTDFAVQKIRLTKQQLRRVDLKPFERFAAADGQLIMIGTATYPAFGGRPAAFNRQIVVGELRRRLLFSGVTITDALEATAARAFGGPGKTAVAAAAAGMDLMLYGDWREALRGQRALARKLRAGKLERIEFRGAVTRILALRADL